MFAEPVPVRRPGVYAIGDVASEEDFGVGVASREGTGRTKMGLNLVVIDRRRGGNVSMMVGVSMDSPLRSPNRQPNQLYPGHPIRNDDVARFGTPGDLGVFWNRFPVWRKRVEMRSSAL